MKKRLRKDAPAREAKAISGEKRRHIDLSGCKLVAPYGRDPHTLESLSAVTKIGTTKSGLKSVTAKGKDAKQPRINLSACKLVAPYGRNPHTFESLSAIATKTGATKPGLKSLTRKG